MAIEDLAANTVQDQGARYKEYHSQFVQKSIFEKLWLIAKGMYNHIYFTWFAPEPQRHIYKGLMHYLSKKQVSSN